MKVTYSSKNGRLSIQLDGDSQKDVFRQISSFQEVFEESSCGACSSEDLRFVVRTVDDNNFYELHCNKCYSRLAFGQHKNKEGTLFPRRKDEEGKVLGKRGWTKWNPETKKEE